MKNLSDDELLAAIATHRDREAFAELYRRYSQDVYRMARYLTGKQDATEDAAQEALLIVWRKANTYRAGNARSWILRITAVVCMQTLKKRKRREFDVDEMAPIADSADPRAPQEQAELLTALRQIMERLSNPDRQIVALYFGANYSQEEIGKELGVGQRTISTRIEQILDKLRQRLAKAGFAAAASTIGARDFLDALDEVTVPERMWDQLTARLDQPLSSPQAASASPSVEVGSFSKYMLAIGALAMAGLGIFILNPFGPPVSPATPAPQTLSPVSQGPEATLNRRWTFDKGPATDLEVFQGTWKWKPGNGDGYMFTPPFLKTDAAPVYTAVLLPQTFGVHPFEILVDATAQIGRNGFQAKWMDKTSIVAHRSCHGPKVKNLKRQRDIRLRIVGYGPYLVSYINGEDYLVNIYAKPYPGDRLVLVLLGYNTHQIEVRALPSDSPEEYEQEIRRMEERIRQQPGAGFENIPAIFMRPGATLRK